MCQCNCENGYRKILLFSTHLLNPSGYPSPGSSFLVMVTGPFLARSLDWEGMEGSCDMDMSVHNEDVIDEDLYSRQLYVMGHEAQKRMAKSDVLIVGLNGLGVETAKNIILAGVKSVTLHDDALVSFSDLSAQFYLLESDIGQPRAKVSAPKLAELNPYVPVTVLEGCISMDSLSKYAVIVLIEIPLDQQLEISSFCHAHNIAVVVADVFGVFGNIFCDFGEAFVVSDTNGEAAASSMIASISTTDSGRA